MKWAVLLVLVGCGRIGFDALSDARAQTRLHLVDNVFDDGTVQPSGVLHDSLLDLDCYPVPTATGFACLPASYDTVYFSDAACSQPITPVPDCGAMPTYAYDAIDLPVAHVYAIGAAVAPAATVYMLQYGGTCAGVTASGSYLSLTEVPLDTFAGLTRVLGGGTRLKTQTLVADDGFSYTADPYDTQAPGSCLAAELDDGTVCSPYSATAAYNYTDAGCTHTVLETPWPVDFGYEYTKSPSCRSTDINVRATLGPITPAKIYVEYTGSGMCQMVGPAPGWQVIDLGPPIPLAPITRQHVPRPGDRIEVIEDVAGDATSIEYNAWDTQLGVECQPEIAGDGVLRCLPSQTTGAQSGVYSDSGCTQPVSVAPIQAPCASSPVPKYALAGTGMACDPRVHLHQVGAMVTAPVYTMAATCTQLTGVAYYAIGPEIDPTTFAAVTEQIEP